MCALTIGGTASATELTGDKAAVVSLVRGIMKAWSDNDTKPATAHLSPSIVITDSEPPYLFQGPTAVADWMKSFAADSAANGITAPWETLGKPTDVEVDGSRAYVAFPSVFGFKQHGKPVRESAMVTVALEKSNEAWPVTSWTWSSAERPSPAMARLGCPALERARSPCFPATRVAVHPSPGPVCKE